MTPTFPGTNRFEFVLRKAMTKIIKNVEAPSTRFSSECLNFRPEAGPSCTRPFTEGPQEGLSVTAPTPLLFEKTRSSPPPRAPFSQENRGPLHMREYIYHYSGRD
jgi:hypothetical protein